MKMPRGTLTKVEKIIAASEPKGAEAVYKGTNAQELLCPHIVLPYVTGFWLSSEMP